MDVLEKTVEWLDEGHPVALLTVVRSFGSTPRHLTAKMVVRADGASEGSIGGGTLEFQAHRDALEALAAGQPRLVDYSLIGKHEGSVGLCGGTQEVFIDVILPEDQEG